MKIYRSILLNEKEAINTENIGNSWTLCSVFAEDHAKDINRRVEKDGYVILEANVEVEMIDWNNTLLAMERRPNEFEVVLIDQELAFSVSLSRIDSVEENAEFAARTGSNIFEDYSANYTGGLTQADFVALAETF